MPVYSQRHFDQIAAAIGVPTAVVEDRASQFEGAALWYRIDRGIPVPANSSGWTVVSKPRPPHAQCKIMEQIAKSARRLYRNLSSNVKTKRIEASFQRLLKDFPIAESKIDDGPGDPEILQLLTYPDGSNEAHVLRTIRQIGKRELKNRIVAVGELERLATQSAGAAARLGELMVPKGHQGDRAVNDWLATMLSLYREITGREPASSVRIDDGVADGPLIRFLMAAAEPAGIRPPPRRHGSGRAAERQTEEPKTFFEDAWRSRVRTLLTAKDKTEVDSAM